MPAGTPATEAEDFPGSSPENCADPRTRNHLDRVVLLALALLLAGVSFAAFWASSRGFDLTDEGAYYLEALYPAENRHTHTSYHLINRVIVQAFKYDIVAVRRTVYVATFLSTLVFWLGFVKFARSNGMTIGRSESFAVYLLLAIGSLLGLSYTPAAFSYNTLNAMLLLCASGLAFVAAGEVKRMRVLMAFTGCCLLIVVDWFVKPTTCLVLLVLLPAFMILCGQLLLRLRILVAGAAVIAVAAAAGSVIALSGHWQMWAERLAIIRVAGDRSVSGGLITRAFHDFFHLWQEAVIRHWIFLGATVVGVLWIVYRRSALTRRDISIATAAAAGGLIIDTLLTGSFRSGYMSFTGPFRYLLTYYLAVLIGVAVLSAVIWSMACKGCTTVTPPGMRWRWIAAVLLLFLLPLAGSFGSGNPFTFNALFQMAPWFVLICMGLSMCRRLPDGHFVEGAGWVFLATMASVQFVHGHLFHPYNLPTSLFEQSKKTRIGLHGTPLRLDPASVKYIKQVRNALEKGGFEEGQDILGLFDLPGLVLAVGGKSPGHSWYFGDAKNGLELDHGTLRRIPAERLKHAFILQQGDTEDVAQVLEGTAVSFPEDYRLIRKVESSYGRGPVFVWAPENPS